MNDKSWVSMSEALARVSASQKDYPDPDLRARGLVLTNIGKCPTKAFSFIRTRENWRGELSSETFKDFALPETFWAHDFGRCIAGRHGEARGRQPDIDCWWDWPSSEFGVIDLQTSINFETVHEAQTAIGVQVHWPSLSANIQAVTLELDGARIDAQGSPASSKGGRRPDYDWLHGFAYLVAAANSGKIDEDPTATEIANHLAEWAFDNYGREPSFSTRMIYANRIIAEIRQLRLKEED